MLNYKDFKDQVFGKPYDIDRTYGAQCWDGYAKYAQYLGQPICHCNITGYVGDIYTQRKVNGILGFNTEVYYLNPGDIVTFKANADWTPYTHIAIYDSDAGNGFGWFLGQNQGGTPYAGGGSAFNLAKLPYAITDTYAFNPNALRDTSTNINKNLNEYGCDDILTVGSHVSSVPIKIGNQGLKTIGGDVCCYLAPLGGWYPISQVSEYDASDGRKDNYLANTNAKVFLDERIVQKLDIPGNRVLLDNGIWVNSAPLIEVKNGR